ncbi:o-succinylbenzoate synthase [Apibacter adventoris]|uniref:o-succinylbenzoate synthase n=1 Tax=Apibacter adventoris TaxID=1679466 RepID=UPI000CF68A56|nr:o-succinylbenzoate synthase [Apibacter adventoris]PQL93278.1 o-succinylbenzoate synthase [Apibacter adventoris]
MKASFLPYSLLFKQPAGTSRGILKTKLTYFIKINIEENEFIGECSFFKGLSADPESEYEKKLQWICTNIEKEEKETLIESCRKFPSIQFGLEQVFQQIKTKKQGLFFESDFTKGQKGILINGLIWMGSLDFMRKQIQKKIAEKYKCIKLKIGINWEEEFKILKNIRKEFSSSDLELRVDANGGFSFDEVKKVLNQLAELEIHSIEQPISAGQVDRMAELCTNSPIPIALDEELIGKFYKNEKEALLKKIKPQYIILKPSLVGGWSGSKEWIKLAEKQNIGWWITSALESNIGLNALAQWTAILNNKMPQGLGTGLLYSNNLPSKLEIRGDKLFYNPEK